MAKTGEATREGAVQTARQPVSQPDWGELVKKAQEMQTRMAQVQQDLARRSVEGTAGGGMVTAVATGELRVREIRIEPSLFESNDRQMVQDLVAAAVNAALTAAQKMVQEELQKVAGPASLNLQVRPG